MSMENLDASGFWPWLLFSLVACAVAAAAVWLLARIVQWLGLCILSRKRKKLEPVQVISEQELGRRFLNAPNNPLWEATLAVLDLQVQEALDGALEDTLTNEQLRTRVGGVAELLRFKANLEDRERAARLTETEAEKQEEEEK